MVHCQTDSTTKYIFGWQISTGGLQQNFTALYKYPYLLDRPQNFSFQYLNPSIFIGNPKKFFVSLFLGTSIGKEKKGTFNNYNIRAGGASSYMGTEIKFPLKADFNKKGLQGIYFSIGGQYMFTSIYSEAHGINPLMRDTTFYYEASKAKNILAKTEIMFEFFGLSKRENKARFPFTFKIGYNFQFSKPNWTGTYYRNVGDENPNINLGGFYFGIGVNWWTTKSFWKRNPQSNK